MRWILAAGVSLGLACAADWPQFRGPNGSGVAPDRDLPVQFGPDRNVAWKVKVPPGTSSPVVAGNRLFLTAFEGDQRIVLCLDAASGAALWRRASAKNRAEVFHPKHGAATPTPAVHGRNVYVFFPEIGLISYDFNGKERWRVPLGPFHSIQGMAASPILAGGNVILVVDQTQDSYVAAFDARSGKRRWKQNRPSGFLGGYSTPVVYRPPRGPDHVTVSGALELTAYRVDTGEKVWWIRGLTNAPASSPVLHGRELYVHEPPGDKMPFLTQLDKNKDGRIAPDEAASDPIMLRILTSIDREWGDQDGALDAAEWDKAFGSFQGNGGLAAIRLDGRGDVSRTHVRWNYKKSLPYVPSILLYQGVIYVVRGGGILTALNPENGEVLRQDRLKDAIDEYYASPVAAGGKVYFVSEQGKVTVVKAGPQWEILATNDLGEECRATPAIANGRLYIRGQETLYCFAGSSS
jgi:outer membrane protein assembly factor BamB